MKAKIIAQDHTVICYTVNGYKKFIVERKPSISRCHKMVNNAVSIVGRKWQDVTDYCNEIYDMTVPLESKINELTY